MKVFLTGNIRSLPIMNDVSNYGNFAAPRAIYILFCLADKLTSTFLRAKINWTLQAVSCNTRVSPFCVSVCSRHHSVARPQVGVGETATRYGM